MYPTIFCISLEKNRSIFPSGNCKIDERMDLHGFWWKQNLLNKLITNDIWAKLYTNHTHENL